MIQTARGGFSFVTRSSREVDPVAPSSPSCFTASELRSETTSECPPRIRRRVMLAPMRPSPTIASCIAAPNRKNRQKFEEGAPLARVWFGELRIIETLSREVQMPSESPSNGSPISPSNCFPEEPAERGRPPLGRVSRVEHLERKLTSQFQRRLTFPPDCQS